MAGLETVAHAVSFRAAFVEASAGVTEGDHDAAVRRARRHHLRFVELLDVQIGRAREVCAGIGDGQPGSDRNTPRRVAGAVGRLARLIDGGHPEPTCSSRLPSRPGAADVGADVAGVSRVLLERLMVAYSHAVKAVDQANALCALVDAYWPGTGPAPWRARRAAGSLRVSREMMAQFDETNRAAGPTSVPSRVGRAMSPVG
ncbi:hypothetical protein AB0D08_11585 [Kitasatospora sp. NPDC048540]|uniref:hypothetical protein n=1 Tax=unclassified Kitasatospora TaxID=2633591 RepID=UPI0011EA6E10|nr:hypothetical protein [Kitasatospora sp. MBT63]